jgi:hypothetical protein
MNTFANDILEVTPFLCSAALALSSFVQYELVAAFLEGTLRENHPATIKADVITSIGNYAADIYARITFALGLMTALIGVLTVGLLRESRVFLLVVALVLLGALYFAAPLLLRSPIGSLTVGEGFWKRKVNRLHVGLASANGLLILLTLSHRDVVSALKRVLSSIRCLSG